MAQLSGQAAGHPADEGSPLRSRRTRSDRVLVVEPDEGRRRVVTGLGAMALSPEDAGERVSDLTAGRGADAVIEASGNEQALRLALSIVRGRGTVSVVGAHFNPAAPIDLGGMFAKETTLRFSIGSPTGDRQRAADLILGGDIDPLRIVSHRLPLDQAPEAYQMFGSRDATKVILAP